jgi:hypothetical protein
MRHWASTLILERIRILGIFVLTVGLAAAVWLMLSLFVFESPAAVEVAAPGGRRLSGDTIDRLELWIEEVDAERKAGFPVPARPMFVIDDLPQAPTP